VGLVCVCSQVLVHKHTVVCVDMPVLIREDDRCSGQVPPLLNQECLSIDIEHAGFVALYVYLAILVG